MTDIVDFDRPYVELDGLPGQADFIEQDGVIYCWSESNVRYERAWWLDPNVPRSPLVDKLRKERQPVPNFVKDDA